MKNLLVTILLVVITRDAIALNFLRTSGRNAFTSGISCNVTVEVTYNDEPVVQCSASCPKLGSDDVMAFGRMFKRFDELTQDHDKMVEVTFNQNEITSCKLVKHLSDHQLSNSPTFFDSCGLPITKEGCEDNFFCKKECPKDWVMDTQNRCYMFSNEEVDLETAKTICPTLQPGAKMLLPEDRIMNNFVKDRIKGKTWIDFSDVEKEGTFVTADGIEPYFTFWEEGEPNNWKDGEDCAEVDTMGLWNDVPCKLDYYYACVL